MRSLYYWPPKSKKITESKEVVLLIKTLKYKFKKIEKEILAFHTYESPAIFSIDIGQVTNGFFAWVKSEINRP